jgi:hypothetical protein
MEAELARTGFEQIKLRVAEHNGAPGMSMR